MKDWLVAKGDLPFQFERYSLLPLPLFLLLTTEVMKMLPAKLIIENSIKPEVKNFSKYFVKAVKLLVILVGKELLCRLLWYRQNLCMHFL